MIKHVVMWKLHPIAEGFSKQENAVRIKQELLKLPSLIPQIAAFEIGLNINNSVNAFDLILNSEFHNREDLAKYQVHPAHMKLKEFTKELRSKITVVDYEV